MKINACFVVVFVIFSFHIVDIVAQYRNIPNTRNNYQRSAARPRPNPSARVQSRPQQAVRGYAPQTVRRTQRQSPAPTYVQTLRQVRPAPSNVRPVRRQAAPVPVQAQRPQWLQRPAQPQQQTVRYQQGGRPQQTVRYQQLIRPQQTVQLQQPIRPQQPVQPQQTAWAQRQRRQPQALASVGAASAVASATATAGGPNFRGAFDASGYGNPEFEGAGLNALGYSGPECGNSGYDRPNFGNQGGYGNGFRPHRSNPFLYRNFASVYKDIDSRADSNDYDASAEMDEINDDFNGRSIVAPGQYPHMAALGFRTASREIEFKCGGSLISEVFVLTAAHCCYFNGKVPDVVKIGDIKLKEREFDNMPQRRRVADIMLHPAYNSTMHYHDIAIILLNRPIVYTYFVRPIRLWVSDEIPYDKLYTMGYGSTSFAQAPTNVLTELDLSVVPWQQCNASLPTDENAPFGIVDSQICAKDYERNRDTCQGDSGGPLQLNLLRRRRRHRFRYYLVGITSYGTFCRSPYPGVYTRVSSYIDWITSIVWPDYFNNFFG